MNDPQTLASIGQIRRSLDERETAELIEIWEKNDRNEWSAEAFAAIREILLDRNGSVPHQAKPAEPEVDTYYDVDKMIRLSERAKNLSWLSLVLFGVLSVLEGVAIILLEFIIPGLSAAYLVLLFIAIGFTALFCGIFWLVSQAIAEGVYVLMDIEENTRKGSR